MQQQQQQPPQKGPPEPLHTTKELFEHFEKMQRQLERYIKHTNKRMSDLEKITASRGEKFEAFQESLNLFKEHLNRMESGLLQEFRLSQQLMKSLLEHDMSIERAKFDFQLKLEEKQNEMKRQQQELELKNKQAREEMKRNLYLRLGVIGAPILVAVTTFIVKFIENL